MYSKVGDTNTRYHSLIQHETGQAFDIHQVNTFCPDTHEPLLAQYDLSEKVSKSILKDRPLNMWRYREFLPIFHSNHIISLGEGFSPILPLAKLANKYGFRHLFMKDESGNPTGSFKARGLGMAVSKATELGIKEFCIPTAGNAGSALSAYTAKAGAKAHI